MTARGRRRWTVTSVHCRRLRLPRRCARTRGARSQRRRRLRRGGARLSIAGVDPVVVNGQEGVVAHDIDVERTRPDGTHVLEALAARVRDDQALFGLAYDFDADRGNLTWVDESGAVRIPSPQTAAAINTAVALALHRRSGDPRRAAVVASDATSRRVHRLAAAFDADVFDVETGEINVVTEMRDLERRGWRAVVGVEGPSGGTVFAGTTCRDGTLVGAGALLAAVDPDVRRIVAETLVGGNAMGPGLAGLVALLPRQRSIMEASRAPVDWAATVSHLDREFPRAFAEELTGTWARFEIVYSHTRHVGPERPAAAAFGWKAHLTAPGKDGFLWIRGSRRRWASHESSVTGRMRPVPGRCWRWGATSWAGPSRPKRSSPPRRNHGVSRAFAFGRSVGVLLVAAAVCLAAGPMAARSARLNFTIEEATIAQVHNAMRAGNLTCRTLVDHDIARITAYDRRGPALGAIVALNGEAVREAERLDLALAASGLVGKLHCVPLVVKDNLETIGMPTTAGSIALKDFVPNRDATVVSRLKGAGAIILGKANMAEFGLNPLTTTNSIFGQTRNRTRPTVWSPARAAARGGGHGQPQSRGYRTETGSSVRGPAAHTSIVGIRPTMGMTSRAGMIPLNHLTDIVGPMARTVEDAVAILDVIAGWDPADPITERLRTAAAPRNLDQLSQGDLKGVRLGIMRQAYQGGDLRIDPRLPECSRARSGISRASAPRSSIRCWSNGSRWTRSPNGAAASSTISTSISPSRDRWLRSGPSPRFSPPGSFTRKWGALSLPPLPSLRQLKPRAAT